MTKMKIIALAGSPSKGRNSDTMLDHFIKGVETIDGLAVEKFYVEDLALEHYRYENKDGPAPHEQVFQNLTRQLEYEAVGLILAAPTYNFSVPAGLKNFIDRIRFIALDLSITNKLGQPSGRLGHLSVYFLISGGTPTWAQKIVFFAFPPFWLRAVFLYYGANVLGAYYSGDTRSFANQKILRTCFNKGIKYGQQVKAGRRHGFLEQIFWRPPQK